MADGVPEEDIFVFNSVKSHRKGYYEGLQSLCAMEYAVKAL